MPFPNPPAYMHNGPKHMKSAVDELVFNRDLDFSNVKAGPVGWSFEPSYATAAAHKLSQHPHRGVPAFQTEEPSYPHASMPHILSDERLRRNRIEINQTPYHHAFVTEKIGTLPPLGLMPMNTGRQCSAARQLPTHTHTHTPPTHSPTSHPIPRTHSPILPFPSLPRCSPAVGSRRNQH